MDAELAIARAVKRAALLEFVEVGVGPAHRDLKHAVELREADVGRHVEPAPDRGRG